MLQAWQEAFVTQSTLTELYNAPVLRMRDPTYATVTARLRSGETRAIWARRDAAWNSLETKLAIGLAKGRIENLFH